MAISNEIANGQKDLIRRRIAEGLQAGRRRFKVTKTEWRPEKRTVPDPDSGFRSIKSVEILWEYGYYPDHGFSGWRKTDQVREAASASYDLRSVLGKSPPARPRFVIRKPPKQSEEELEQIRAKHAELAERAAARAACDLLISLARHAKRQEILAERGPKLPRTVRSYPSLLNAAYKAKYSSEMRLWLLLRAYDPDGRGYFDIADIRHRFTGKRSRWRFCKWPRLRQILAKGDGIFWDRHTDGSLWLRSPARIANAIGCSKLEGLPVLLPVSALKGSIAKVKAHFYASYESGRRGDDPLSLAALEEITGVPERTQRAYNKLLKRKSKKNITVTSLPYNLSNAQDLSYDKQRIIFKFVDWVGMRGPERSCYPAYRIADSRNRCHKQAAKGRQRKCNHAINLVKNLARGKHGNQVARAYYQTAEAAAKSFNRSPDHDHYWPDGNALQPNVKRKSRLEGVRIWGVLLA